uniref:Disease resistance R13L4/SHOC-2-like LRR domain-containing protein n=1 Tax=Amphimedon queenslandica TaxID=400682 RepID=A0A1X7VWK9_AMPQE
MFDWLQCISLEFRPTTKIVTPYLISLVGILQLLLLYTQASLNLSNNRLSFVPEDIGSLSGLEELFLQYNHLAMIPSSICHLSFLRELDLKNNNLTSLPNEIGSLSLLNILCVTNNRISSLPSSIGKLRNLEELTLHSNELAHLPSEICLLKDLKLLYCGDNKLQSLPDQFGKLVKLEELDFSGCELVKLPESFSNCKSLIRVWLCNNRLVQLPVQIGNLVNLKELHVRKNKIRMFPMSMRSLTLYTFTAQENPIIKENQRVKLSDSPTDSFPSLLELSARAIIRTQINEWKNEGAVPTHLADMLSHYDTCSTCGRPFFKFFSYHVAFHLVGVYYKLPLYEYCCSPHNPISCSVRKHQLD